LAFLSLKKVASSCRHPDDVMKERALCTEKVDLVRSCLTMARADLGALAERLNGVEQKSADLEDALRLGREEEC